MFKDSNLRYSLGEDMLMRLVMVIPRSHREHDLLIELCELPVFYGGGGRIRTHVARQGGRFTVCSD